MTASVSLAQALKGMASPMSMEAALDPFLLKQSSKLSPMRIAWTLQNRLIERRANREAEAALPLAAPSIVHLENDRGGAQEDTAVTLTQLDLLLAAQREASAINPNLVEIGSFRGATTAQFAANTHGTVYAVDPFAGYGGSEEDFAKFRLRTAQIANVDHIRKTSGAAAATLPDASVGMVFIDGVHDFSNSWFDFSAWSGKVAPGGMIAFHDVDDHPGVRLAVRNLIEKDLGYAIWAYCPNLIIFTKPAGKALQSSGD